MSSATHGSATGDESWDDPVHAPEPGRSVVLVPTPPGSRRAVLGGAVAVLAPLFGFLIGGIFGAGAPGDAVDPMFLSLFIGIVIGGIGLLVACAGGARLWRHFHSNPTEF